MLNQDNREPRPQLTTTIPQAPRHRNSRLFVGEKCRDILFKGQVHRKALKLRVEQKR